jgi:hypothetical protein
VHITITPTTDYEGFPNNGQETRQDHYQSRHGQFRLCLLMCSGDWGVFVIFGFKKYFNVT